MREREKEKFLQNLFFYLNLNLFSVKKKDENSRNLSTCMCGTLNVMFFWHTCTCTCTLYLRYLHERTVLYLYFIYFRHFKYFRLFLDSKVTFYCDIWFFNLEVMIRSTYASFVIIIFTQINTQSVCGTIISSLFSRSDGSEKKLHSLCVTIFLTTVTSWKQGRYNSCMFTTVGQRGFTHQRWLDL